MPTLFDLLTFPTTSDAFTAIRPSITDDMIITSTSTSGGTRALSSSILSEDGSASRRKISRLDADSDAASASSNRSSEKRVDAHPQVKNENEAHTWVGRGGDAHVADYGAVAGGMRSTTEGFTSFDQKPKGIVNIQIISSKGIEKQGKATLHRDKYLDLLRRCIQVMLAKDGLDSLPATYESIYWACEYVVTTSGIGERLYDTVKLELERGLGRLANMLLEDKEKDMGVAMDVEGLSLDAQNAQAAIEWLGRFVDACDWFENQIHLIKSFLTYLDQGYILGNKDLMKTRDLAYYLFTERIFENAGIAIRLRNGLEAWLSWERGYRLPHDSRPQLIQLISHLVAHKQYSVFEDHYIKLTHSFYSVESKEQYEKMKDDPEAYFRHVRHRIEEEDQRAKEVLLVGSWGIIRSTTETALWDGRLEWVVTTVGTYMAEKNLEGLGTMFTLFSRIGQIPLLCQFFKKYLEKAVSDVVLDVEQDDKMLERLLDLKAFADKSVNQAFLVDNPSRTANAGSKDKKSSIASTSATNLQPHQDFVYALSDAFTNGFKKRRNKPAEMIAKYLDKAMRKGQGSTSDTAFEALLDSVLALYRFTDDKDVFRTFYHRALAKRLLLEKSASDDFEAAMLKKLKEKYDPEFGMGEEMFKDLALSRELMRDYHSRLDASHPGQTLSVMVLQRSAWPFTVQKKGVDLPTNMQEELTKFVEFYKQKHSGHVLSFDHALGTATLKARFSAGVKELSVSLYQAVVLLLFNDSEDMKYPEIMDATRMDDAELRRTLQSLACGKKKVLKKVPPGRDVDDGDTFRFNPDFDDPHPKVHINSIQAKVSPEESKRTQQMIEGDRKHYLDAAIVRIMKARKELTYEQLKAATIDAVKSHFVPSVEIIKTRVDALVEMDYLERSKKDKSSFLYVA